MVPMAVRKQLLVTTSNMTDANQFDYPSSNNGLTKHIRRNGNMPEKTIEGEYDGSYDNDSS